MNILRCSCKNELIARCMTHNSSQQSSPFHCKSAQCLHMLLPPMPPINSFTSPSSVVYPCFNAYDNAAVYANPMYSHLIPPKSFPTPNLPASLPHKRSISSSYPSLSTTQPHRCPISVVFPPHSAPLYQPQLSILQSPLPRAPHPDCRV